MRRSYPLLGAQALLNGLGKRLFRDEESITDEYLVEVIFRPSGVQTKGTAPLRMVGYSNARTALAAAKGLIRALEGLFRQAQKESWYATAPARRAMERLDPGEYRTAPEQGAATRQAGGEHRVGDLGRQRRPAGRLLAPGSVHGPPALLQVLSLPG